MKTLPPVTHLQFLVLEHLATSARAGAETRAMLAEHGARRTRAAFYQLMSRLEDAGLVAGHYAQREVRGQTVKVRRYTITPGGEKALAATRDFYRARLAPAKLERA